MIREDRARLPGRDSFRVWREVTTRWKDNDVYGHANNVVYYEWFDTAVNAWLIEAGLLDIVAGDPIGLVVETSCRFAHPVGFPQRLDVGLVVERIGNSSVHYRLGVFAEGSEEAAAEGYFIHVYVGRDTREPMRVPDAWRRALEGIAAPPRFR